MIEDLKVLLTFGLMAVAAAIIRFKTTVQLVIDTILGFVMGYTLFLCLDFTDFSGASKCGMACAAILWSRPLYDAVTVCITKFLSKIFEKWLSKNDI